MNRRFLSILLCLFIVGCKPETKTAINSLDLISGNYFALIKINNYTAFNSDLKNNHFLNSLRETSPYTTLSRDLAPLKYLQSNGKALIAFYHTKDSVVDFLLAAPYAPDLFDTEKAVDLIKETYTYKDRVLDKYTIDGKVIFGRMLAEHLLLSSSDSLLGTVFASEEPYSQDPAFTSLLAAANPDRNATVFLKLETFAEVFAALLNPTSQKEIGKFSDWISLDISSQQDYLILNGITIPADTLANYVSLFQGGNALPLVSPSYAPETAQAVISYAVQDFSSFSAQMEAYTGTKAANDSLFQTLEEVGVILDPAGKTVLLNTYGSEKLSHYLRDQSVGAENYQDHELLALNGESLLSDNFSPLVDGFKANYCTTLDNTLVFASDREALINLITHHNLGTTFDKTEIYTTAKDALADEANILAVAGQQGLGRLFETALEGKLRDELKKIDFTDYGVSAQLVAEGNFYHCSLLIQRTGANRQDKPTAPRYTMQFDTPLATDPQLVINHRTNKKEIVVQDEDNNLYLISTEGKLLWKKQLEGRIQGNISQVDLYKNGRLQLAFTTDNQFLILDRNGKEVPPFTMKFQGGNLNPLAVFDYENNRNYRFMVTQGSDIRMYDSRGKIVSGFTYTKAESPVLPSPQHIRLGNRDYLIFRLENGALKILNRVGQTRVKVEEKIDFSSNEVYAYKNQFALTDKQGTLYMVSEQGKITKTAFGLNQDHGMEATSKSLAYMNENILNIKGSEAKLEYGVYTAPAIFYLYDKIYVSVTDLQSRKVYLFDSNADPIPGFPVAGSSAATLGDMENDRQLELVCRLEENSLIVYRLN